MIQLQNYTPEVYYNESRDFQFLGRLFDVVLNSIKTNADLIYALPISTNSDDQLVDLVSLTLGFKSKHNYNVQQLVALCNSFANIIREKGSIASIINAANALLNAEGISELPSYEFAKLADNEEEYDYTKLIVFLPQELTDINLFKDLLLYILPAGVSCTLSREFKLNKTAETYVATSDKITYYYNENGEPSSVGGKAGGVEENVTSRIPLVHNNSNLKDARIKAYEGFGANSTLWKKEHNDNNIIINTTDKETK